MAKMLIIADDLTGSLDTATHFADKQVSTAVITDIDNLKYFLDKYDVLAVSTESRHKTALEAAKAVRTATECGVSAGIRYYYKKIDSTFRGNIGAELEALLDTYGNSELMLIPSFCKMGRTVSDGRLYVNAVPVSETAFSKDPLDPVKKDSITDIIREQTDIPVHLIKNAFDLSSAGEERRIYLFDAETEEDLYKIGELLARQRRIGITAGSAGFAGYLSDMPVFEKRMGEGTKTIFPMLTVCGSRNEVSRRQIGYAEGLGQHIIGIDLESIEGCVNPYTPSIKLAITQAVDFLKDGKNVIIKTIPSNILTLEATGTEIKKESLNIAIALGSISKNIIDQSGISTLMIFGGDTVSGILNSFGIICVEPLKEIIPGVSLSKTVNQRYHLQLITKAGGFGGDDLIEKVMKFMEG